SLRGRRLRAQQRWRRVPEPDVPLPAARDSLRRLGARERPRLPGARRADDLRRARLGEDRIDRPARPPRAALQLPLHGAGPPRVDGGDPRRAAHPRAVRLRRVQRGRALAGHVRAERQADPGLGRTRRRDGAPSVVHVPDGGRRARRRRPGDAARARARRAARRRRIRLSFRSEWEHLRAGDDGRREGGRPDPRRDTARSVDRRVLPAPRPRAAAVMHIGGRWVESESGVRTEATSPATGESIGSVPEGTREDARRAIAAANAAARDWAARSAFERAAAMNRVAELVEERRDELARTLTLDQGKPLHAEAYGEVDELVEYW